MPSHLKEYWASLEDSSHSQAMPKEVFEYQIEQMNMFMKLVLKIAFTHLYHDGNQANELYDSFFPKKQENA